MLSIGQQVSTEYGNGMVTESSYRRVCVALETGETINVVVGTFGYERIKAI